MQFGKKNRKNAVSHGPPLKNIRNLLNARNTHLFVTFAKEAKK